MYRLLRNTHLFLGLFLCLFILTYGVSSLMFAYPTWFSSTPTITEQNLLIDPEVAANPRDLARELMDQQVLRGVLGKIRKNDDGYRFRVYRTGTNVEVRYTTETGIAHIKTRANDFMGMVKAIHVGTVGVQTGYWLQDLWGWFVVLVSVALILLGATGIYLWFNIHAERLIGTVLLTVGLVWGLTLTVLLYIP
jgi:hypothetical protein